MLWLGVLALAAFFPFLGFRQIATSHEARVTETAREMAETGWPWNAQPVEIAPVKLVKRGGKERLEPDEAAPRIRVNSWVVPLMKGEVRLQKPPLPYWCAAILFRLVGFSETAARFTPALLGAIGTVVMYDLARMLMGRRRAWFAALFWSSTFFIPDEHRKAMADPYLAFFALTCVWSWIKASMDRSLRNRIASVCLLLFYVSLALGLLAKGPPLLVHLSVALTAYHFCYRRRLPRGAAMHAIGLGVMLLIALPWPIAILHKFSNAREIWRFESVGELADNAENARPWWFYFPNLPLIALPWAAVWVVGWVFPIARRRIRRVSLFPLIWMATTILFFSFVKLKKNPYLLPTMPAQTLLLAQGLAMALSAARRSRPTDWPAVVVGAQAVLGVGVAIALPIAVFSYAKEKGPVSALAAVAIAVSMMAMRAAWRRPLDKWVPLQAATYVLLALVYMLGVVAPQDNARSAKALATELAVKAAEPGRTLLIPRLPEEVAVYLPRGQVYSRTARAVLVVRDDQRRTRVRQRGLDADADDAPSPTDYAGWFPEGQVLLVTRVPMQSAPDDARWKVYELIVERRMYANASPPSVSDGTR